MPIDIVIPEMGESIRTGVISRWLRSSGEVVAAGDPVLELETDKITLEVPAPVAGALTQAAEAGATVAVGAVVGRISESAQAPASAPATKPAPGPAPNSAPQAAPQSKPATTQAAPQSKQATPEPAPNGQAPDIRATPLARKLADEHAVDLASVPPTGAGGRVREQDVLAFVQSRSAPRQAPAPVASAPQSPSAASRPAHAQGDRAVRRERMSPLRQRIAQRLVEAQHAAAMLTTFNECDMTAVMDLRKRYKDDFEKRHGVGLGFMSFFIKAAVHALQAFPAANASLVSGPAGIEIEYHDYADIAIAVGTPKGLTVPVLRDCQRRSFAEIEHAVRDVATRARDGKLALEELQGGTFTITNGGIYGSLMSTPILNPPQTAILGMHAIKSRAVEHPDRPGELALRPMMYLALSYDHRVIDGAEAVGFLVAIKNAIEAPSRLLLAL